MASFDVRNHNPIKAVLHIFALAFTDSGIITFQIFYLQNEDQGHGNRIFVIAPFDGEHQNLYKP